MARGAEKETAMKMVRRILGTAAIFLIGAVGIASAKVAVSVSGLGMLRDRETRLALEQLMNLKAVNTVSANAIEDAAVIINAALDQDGF